MESLLASSPTDLSPSPRWRRRRLTVAIPLTIFVNYLSLTSFTVSTDLPEIWFCAAAGFFWLTAVWDGRKPQLTPALLASLAGIFVAFALIALVVPHPLGEPGRLSLSTALRLASGNLIQSVLFVWLYRRAVTSSWAPRSPHELLTLVWAPVLAAALVLPIGAAPGLSLFEADPTVWMWWVVRNGVACFVGPMTVLVMFDRRPHWPGVRAHPWRYVALAIAAALGLTLAYSDPNQPLSWIILVPAVWAGMILRPWGAAFTALMVGLGAAAYTMLPQNQFLYGGMFPPAILMDLLITTSAYITQLLALFRDQRNSLTRMLRQEREDARGQAHLLSSMFDAMSDGFLIISDDGVPTRYNAAAERLLACDLSTLGGYDWGRAVGLHRLDGDPMDIPDLGAFHRPDGAPHTVRMVLKNAVSPPSGMVVEITGSPIRTHGQLKTLLLFHDATEDQQRLDELKGFARTVAHDLRGPLAGLIGWLEMAEQATDEAESHRLAGRASPLVAVHETLHKAQQAGQSLDAIIEGWLGHIVTRSGAMTPAPVKVGHLVREAVEVYAAAPGSEDHNPRTPAFTITADDLVMADATLVRQVLANLVGNAVKYARPDLGPEVEITTRRSHGWVEVSVRDNGLGIDPGAEESIFDDGWRGSAQAASLRGNGLGLALCRRIVERHGGRIWAHHNQTEGSTISFTLPAAN